MTTTPAFTSTTLESSGDYLDSGIQRKQDEILQVKQRLVRLQVELSQLKKRKASMKTISSFREQLKAVMRPG
jgi:hypothetical protein